MMMKVELPDEKYKKKYTYGDIFLCRENGCGNTVIYRLSCLEDLVGGQDEYCWEMVYSAIPKTIGPGSTYYSAKEAIEGLCNNYASVKPVDGILKITKIGGELEK